MPSYLQYYLIQNYLKQHKDCLPSMTDHVTLLKNNFIVLWVFVCEVIPVSTVITFDVGSVVTIGVIDSSKSVFWKSGYYRMGEKFLMTSLCTTNMNEKSRMKVAD